MSLIGSSSGFAGPPTERFKQIILILQLPMCNSINKVFVLASGRYKEC